jgi:hypothetical protein
MSDIAKQILKEMNQPLHERLKNQFINYLREIEQDKLIKTAKKINWEPVVKLFEVEYTKLWNKMAVPKIVEGLEGLKTEFASIVLANIKQRLFNSTYRYLMIKINENKINDENMNSLMNELFNSSMYDLFRVFDYQFTLTSLNKNNDKKVMIRKIEDLRKRAEFGDKFSGKKQLNVEERVFKMIDEKLIDNEKVGKRRSMRAECDYYGRYELGYGIDKEHLSELDLFYKRYLTHRKNNNPDT